MSKSARRIAFVYVEADDETTDSEHELHVNGSRTRFCVQCSMFGGYLLNEYFFAADGSINAVKFLREFKSLAKAKDGAIAAYDAALVK